MKQSQKRNDKIIKETLAIMKKASRQPNGSPLVSTMHVTGSGRSFLTCTLSSTILVSEETREFSDWVANGDRKHYARFTSLSKGNSIVNGQNRKDIRPGLQVEIVMKQDQRSGRRTRGIVKDILTSSLHHSRGIKVRLESGAVGRVQEIVG